MQAAKLCFRRRCSEKATNSPAVYILWRLHRLAQPGILHSVLRNETRPLQKRKKKRNKALKIAAALSVAGPGPGDPGPVPELLYKLQD